MTSHLLNVDALNAIGESIRRAVKEPPRNYVWVDGTGEQTNLSDPSSYVVLRDGIDGFSGTTSEYSIEPSPNNMAEILQQTNVRQRQFGFRVVILGENHADLEVKRKNLLRAFSPNLGIGKLMKKFDDGTYLTISCVVDSGYPSIPDGLPMGYQARSQVVEIRFIAPDPYFYGSPVTASGDENGLVTVENPGDVSAPCKILIKKESCTNYTTHKTMAAYSGRSIVGLTVTVDDRRVHAVDGDGANKLMNFTRDSVFWMLERGTNELYGVDTIEFTPRWSGV